MSDKLFDNKKTFDILHTIRNNKGMGLREIRRNIGHYSFKDITKIRNELRDNGYIVVVPSRKKSIKLKYVHFQSHYLTHKGERIYQKLTEIIKQKEDLLSKPIEHLAEKVGIDIGRGG